MPNLMDRTKVVPTSELLPKSMNDALMKQSSLPTIFNISDDEFRQLRPEINSIQEQCRALANHAMQQEMKFLEAGLLHAHQHGRGFAFRRTMELVQCNRREDQRVIVKQDYKITDIPPSDPEWVFVSWYTINETVQRMRLEKHA